MNLAKDAASWERTVSVTPLSDDVRRKAALQVAGQAIGFTKEQRQADCAELLEHLGLLDPNLRGKTTT
ncbi:hypothetical protein [Streptomyces sp. TRM49041]|uniref:hypothetical protein n=1 Tax=Streptomyces sp. TRM49041 TaxID=2603216 RepID=UPI0011EC3DC0|nr:hypothetical protein [Streptomyces sp. TRM49041]